MCHETHFSDQENGKSIDDIIDEFNNKEQSPFLQAQQEELDTDMKVNNPAPLPFDVFNENIVLTELKKKRKNLIKTLLKLYGSSKSSVFQVDDNQTLPLVAATKLDKDRVPSFFDDSEIKKEKAIKNLNKKKKGTGAAKKAETRGC